MQVLFGRADLAVGRPAGDRPTALFPAGEDPLAFAYHRWPSIARVLAAQAHRYRFDFVHTRVDGAEGSAPDLRPCGLDGALDWMLAESARRGPRVASPPTSFWLDVLAAWDRRRGRAARWRRLPPPRSLL